MNIESIGTIEECFTWNDNLVSFERWEKSHDKLTDELLNIRLSVKTLTFITHNNYINRAEYWQISEVDSSHGSCVVILPNPIDDFDLYKKVRTKMISRIQSTIKRVYKLKGSL